VEGARCGSWMGADTHTVAATTQRQDRGGIIGDGDGGWTMRFSLADIGGTCMRPPLTSPHLISAPLYDFFQPFWCISISSL
jgi:hypothetical protein